MVKDITLPKVSENVETGDVVKVLVNVGDTVDVDQSIIELETDKALFEVPSSEKGKVVEVNVKEGDEISVGQVIIKVETNGQDTKEEQKTTSKSNEPEDSNKEKIPSANGKPEQKAGIEDQKSNEDTKEDSEKAVKEQKPVKAEKEEAPQAEKSETKSDKSEESDKSKVIAPAAPSVRRLAREIGVDINSVNGTGPGGRITEDDVKNYAKNMRTGGTITHGKSYTASDFEKWGEIKTEKMSKVRQITAEGLTVSWSTVPQVTQFDETDITELEKFRKSKADQIKDAGGHLTMTSIITKIIAEGLRIFPKFNASVDMLSKQIIYKNYINIGIAVATDRGLLVPVIKNADQKNLTEISIEITELSEKARNKKIAPEEMEGGTFTISNLGGIGGTNFSPIVYSPQVAILGVSRAKMEPVYENETFVPRLIMPLSLSYDHKLIDGADAARFLRWVCEALQFPLTMNL